MSQRTTRFCLKKRWFVAGIAVAAVTWMGIDLHIPRSADIRRFDPNEVARLETAMWRMYYNGERLRLFNELAELVRKQYHLPFIKSNEVAYHAARAAFVFKDGENHAEYEKALPNLVSFYGAIRQVSNAPFDVDRAARLELEWWIVHREREKHAPGDLERALAELPAEVYHVPVERLMEHARLRAEAMLLRDAKAAAAGMSEEDWARIEALLRASWQSLWKAVNS